MSLRTLIAARYPAVQWMTGRQLARRLASEDGNRPILLDAREPGEFEVSHLRGARRVDPERPDFHALRSLRNRTVVVYCSVGWRSGSIADQLRERGFRRVFNLEGGIFRWANDERPLYRRRTRVHEVHPYDSVWGRMLEARYRASILRRNAE